MHDLFATYTKSLHTNNTILFQFGSLSSVKVQKYAHSNKDVKNGAIHIPINKIWISHIQFSWEKGANRIPGSAEKGGYSGRKSVPCHIYGVIPPPPPKWILISLSYTVVG